MRKLKKEDILQYVKDNIYYFHEQKTESLNKLKLSKVLRRKNPYLFKAKHLLTADEIVRSITDAHISSNEETIFGEWLEGLAIFINKKAYGGRKSSTTGIDLEFDNEGIRYLVSVKSGPNWANSDEKRAMKQNFKNAIKTLKTSNSKINAIPIEGCCYGRSRLDFKDGLYYKYCGQVFWEFISGDPNLYVEIVEPLGHKAKARNEDFNQLYGKKITKFISEFIQNFCTDDFDIDWEKLVEFNSGKRLKKYKK